MGIICCFNCGYSKKMDNRRVRRLQQELEYKTTERIHKCRTNIYRKSNIPDIKFFVNDPYSSKLIYGEFTYRGYCANCYHSTNKLTEDEVRYWFFFIHLRSDFAVKQKCKNDDYRTTYIESYRSKKVEKAEQNEELLQEILDEAGITKDQLSQETVVEQGDEELAAWVRIDPGRNNVIELDTAMELLKGECPLCDYSFTFDNEIKTKAFVCYNEFMEPQYRERTFEEKLLEFLHQRFTNLNAHFKEYHFFEYANHPERRVPKQVNIAMGMLQQLVIYENSLKMEHNLRTSSQSEKQAWKREHNNRSLLDRYNEFDNKRASITRKLYKDYLLPTKMIAQLLQDTDTNIRIKGYRGMLVNDDIPKWLLDVTSKIISEEIPDNIETF